MYRLLGIVKLFIEFLFIVRPFNKAIESGLRCQTPDSRFHIQEEVLQDQTSCLLEIYARWIWYMLHVWTYIEKFLILYSHIHSIIAVI